jgi:hypothetical protein
MNLMAWYNQNGAINMADNYQIYRYGTTGFALINWITNPALMASTFVNQSSLSLPSSLAVVTGCDPTQLTAFITAWQAQSSVPLQISQDGSSPEIFSQILPSMSVQIAITQSGNTLIVNDWNSAVRLSSWSVVNSNATVVTIL